MQRIPTAPEAELWFNRLTGALSTYRLASDREQTSYRQVGADEFMLMTVDTDESCGWSEARFKHRDSRNYLWLRYQAYSDASYPVVPIGGAFHGGYFPAPVPMDEENIGTAE